MNINNPSSLCQTYLNIVYHGMRARAQNTAIFTTYGEILYAGMEKILTTLSLSENDIFLDLGSGLGKVVAQVFLRTKVKAAYGIELLPELHHQALIIARKLREELPNFYHPNREFTLLLGDFLKTSLPQATVLLLASPCFTQPIMHALSDRIEKMPSVHTVLTLRPLPNLRAFKFQRAVRIECSWDTALCYVYEKRIPSRESRLSKEDSKPLSIKSQ